MKKILFFTVVFTASTPGVYAQSNVSAINQKDTLLFLFNAMAILLAMYILSSFLLAVIRMFLHDRLKKALLEKQASEEVIRWMLPRQSDQLHSALKWCCVLILISIGLTACYYTQPLGLHSVIFLTFSAGLGFLAFFLIMKRKK